MRTLVQRVTQAAVTVDSRTVGSIERGLLVFVGVGREDTVDEAEWLAKRVAGLRVFETPDGKMNLSVNEVGGSVLAVPQFTLYGECRKGMRPDFINAAPPDAARPVFDAFVDALRRERATVATGAFREHMHVTLVNDGPVTLWIERAHAASGAQAPVGVQ